MEEDTWMYVNKLITRIKLKSIYYKNYDDSRVGLESHTANRIKWKLNVTNDQQLFLI